MLASCISSWLGEESLSVGGTKRHKTLAESMALAQIRFSALVIHFLCVFMFHVIISPL